MAFPPVPTTRWCCASPITLRPRKRGLPIGFWIAVLVGVLVAIGLALKVFKV